MDYYRSRAREDGAHNFPSVQRRCPGFLTSASQLEKYKKADFGRCPRVLCQSQPLLPVGLSDVPYEKSVKLYCGRCEDIYSPKSSRHGSIDGAYFGTSFPHMLFLVYPAMIPPKSGPPDMSILLSSSVRSSDGGDSTRRRRAREDPEALAEGVGEGVSTSAAALKAERYRPKIFGFQVNEIAKLQRWQEAVRDRYVVLHWVQFSVLIMRLTGKLHDSKS